MPITSSAKKALRASKNKALFNARRKDAITSLTKKVKKLILEKKIKEAEAMLPAVYQAIDKAYKTKMIHKNTAARKKSRITKFVEKASKQN